MACRHGLWDKCRDKCKHGLWDKGRDKDRHGLWDKGRDKGGTQVMLVYASGQCMEQRSCGCSQLWHSAPPGMAVGCCELRLRSTPLHRLVCNCFPDPGGGLPIRILPRCLQQR